MKRILLGILMAVAVYFAIAFACSFFMGANALVWPVMLLAAMVMAYGG